MYLYWQRRNYANSWEMGGQPPWSYSVSVAKSVRETGAKRPHRHIVLYLGSVNPTRQQEGDDNLLNHWSACRLRCVFWLRVRRRLAAAVADGRLTEAECARIIAELTETVPPPSEDHFGADDTTYSYHDWHGCGLAPVHVPAHVLAAATRYWKRDS